MDVFIELLKVVVYAFCFSMVVATLAVAYAIYRHR